MLKIEDVVRERFSDLSTGQKKVAEYLLQNTFEYSMSTVAQLAKKVNVSETTIIRLSYALGFESFSSMQKYIQQQFLNKSTKEEFEISDENENKPNGKNLIDLTIKRDISILESMVEKIDTEKVWEIVNLLIKADQVKIAGFRASFSPAHWFFSKLSMMRENVSLISSVSSLNSPDELLSFEKKNTVFLLLSFPSYISETLTIANIAKEQGATVIAISDRILSPVARISDICITTDINVSSENLISVSSVHSLLNLIATGVELKNEKDISERVRAINEMFSVNGYYLE